MFEVEEEPIYIDERKNFSDIYFYIDGKILRVHEDYTKGSIDQKYFAKDFIIKFPKMFPKEVQVFVESNPGR